MSTEAAKLLTKTADHIEAVGLNQDGDYFSREDREAGKPLSEQRCCTLGAMSLVTRGIVGDVEFTYGTKHRARSALLTMIHDGNPDSFGITEWSDTTDPAEVLTTLRSTAQKLEERP